MATTKKIALITGANRGIGRATALRFAQEGFHVIAAARDTAKLAEVLRAIAQAGGSAEALALDVSQAASIAHAAQTVMAQHGKLDVLMNNAGIFQGYNDTALTANLDELTQSIQVNALGPLMLTQALSSALKAAGGARVVNVASAAGSLAEIVNPDSMYGATEGAPYRLSKVALNGVTALLAKALHADGIKVNSMCPGWTQTDMGGEGAPNTPSQAAAVALRLATLPADGPTGGFFNEAGAMAW